MSENSAQDLQNLKQKTKLRDALANVNRHLISEDLNKSGENIITLYAARADIFSYYGDFQMSKVEDYPEKVLFCFVVEELLNKIPMPHLYYLNLYILDQKAVVKQRRAKVELAKMYLDMMDMTQKEFFFGGNVEISEAEAAG